MGKVFFGRNFKWSWLSVALLLNTGSSFAQESARVYPTHWWTGMKWNKVQLLVHAPNINADKPAVRFSYPGVTLQKTTRTESPNYLVLDLVISPAARPGMIRFQINTGNQKRTIPFELKQRRSGKGQLFATGITSADFVYLVMPDRFANGNPGNDKIAGYRDTICDRTNPSARHGGDIEGVMQQLPYLQNLGVSAVWMCPVVENDMPWKQEPQGAISGYHGYWITNHYEIDKRHGGNEAYKKLVETAHGKGMKIIQDAVYNHVGDEHFLFRDKPFADMFNQWTTYTGSNHREEALMSSYSTSADKKVMLDGWFTPHLPDVNQRNPYMANFLIQNALWCTEEFGVDGWRVDTYKYCDEAFLNRINDALLTEYPQLGIFGEAWSNTVPSSAYFTRNNMKSAFAHNLPGTTDFPMQSAMLTAINQDFGWTEGVNKLMMTLSQDGLYQDPSRNCIFLDNHDMDRFMTMVGGDFNKYKMGIALLLTLRGIPQLYYGTEILMKNDPVQGDGKKRNDFPGGFPGDPVNKFAAAQRSARENEAFEYVKTIAGFRKHSQALTAGTTHQFLPRDGIFVYARKAGKETVLVVVNQNRESKQVPADRFSEMFAGFVSGREITSGTNVPLKGSWTVPGQTVWIVSLKQ